ncbi:MAG: PDDEXK nuclease domain-containing protein [Candidatus Firestonebacteria bacterium]
MAVITAFNPANSNILSEIRGLIESARGRVAYFANTELTMLYWHVGDRIRREILKEKRAEYGLEILPTLSAKLMPLYGDGFSDRNLARMVKFAECFPIEQIVVTLSRQLSWSHFVEILPVKDQLARDFYAEMCRIERWNVRTLRAKIGGMLFERTALSKKPEKLAHIELSKLREEDKLTPDLVFRDPYFLDFLGLKGAYQEKDIESAILSDLEAFILEIGTGFSFLARQKRMIIGGDDFYLDLLFYHRGLKRLVAIELKLDKFKPEYKGQMEIYLRWLDKYERNPGESHPLGLILCAGKSDEQVELLELGKSGIRVADYLTELPPREVLEKKLNESIRMARLRLEAAKNDK